MQTWSWVFRPGLFSRVSVRAFLAVPWRSSSCDEVRWPRGPGNRLHPSQDALRSPTLPLWSGGPKYVCTYTAWTRSQQHKRFFFFAGSLIECFLFRWPEQLAKRLLRPQLLCGDFEQLGPNGRLWTCKVMSDWEQVKVKRNIFTLHASILFLSLFFFGALNEPLTSHLSESLPFFFFFFYVLS